MRTATTDQDRFVTRPLLLAALALLAGTSAASAIIIRHDVPDAKYLVPTSVFPALALMPGEGGGVLIAPHWVVTVAHAVTWQHEVTEIMLNGTPRKVERIVLHPGYAPPPKALLDQSLESWEWSLFRASLAASDDLALIKLAEPVTDVVPAALHTGGGEFGQHVRILGTGATGNGATGYNFSDSHRTALRRSENRITTAYGRYMCYVFDNPKTALPLEGGIGSGDSGGPVLMQVGERTVVAGLTSWSDAQSPSRTPGLYGQVACNIRLSHYAEWIAGVMSAE